MKKFISSVGLALLPGIAFAQFANPSNSSFSTLLDSFGTILTKLFPIAIALAVLAFFYEVIMFIFNRGTDKADHFKKGILFSILAIFLMLTFFGILKVIANTLGLNGAVGASITTDAIPVVQIN